MSLTDKYLKKKTKATGELKPAASMKSRIEDGLAASAGTTGIKSRDPIYHLSESFKSTFDLCGQKNASRLAEANDFNYIPEEMRKDKLNSGNPDEAAREGQKEQWLGEPDFMAEGNFYSKFSEVAFNNGRLAAAVLQNGGKTMFVSCLKRTLGYSGPVNSMQSKLFSASSVRESVKNSLAGAAYNRYVNSAAGLVVGSIHSARQTLQFFQQMASDYTERAVQGMKGDTLRKMYPFLNISKDQESLVEYEGKLNELTKLTEKAESHNQQDEIERQKAVLNAGITKTRALVAKKRQMEYRFFTELNQLLENSRKAQEIFSDPGFKAQVTEELSNDLELQEDDGDDGGAGSGKGRKKGKKPEVPSEG